MNYEQMGRKYLEVRAEIDRINKAAKTKVAELAKIQTDLENLFALKAEEDGLENIKTPVGTAYWTNLCTASVAEPSTFKGFVIANSSWDLMETRAAKLAVKSYVEAHGEVPPGINYSTYRSFNFRQS